MSIWLGLKCPDVAISDGTLFCLAYDRDIEDRFYMIDTGTLDYLENMESLGWGLIAPAALSKWLD